MALLPRDSNLDSISNVVTAFGRLTTHHRDHVIVETSSDISKPPGRLQRESELINEINRTGSDDNSCADAEDDDTNFHGVAIGRALLQDCIGSDFFQTYGFKNRKSIASGATGHVFEAISNSYPYNLRALKLYSFTNDKLDRLFSEKLFVKEIAILQAVNHRHILNDFQAYICMDYGVLEMDLYQEGTLREAFTNRPKHLLDRYFIQTACAIRYLHSHRYVHRDVKLQNILICGDEAVLIDFAFAERLPKGCKTIGGFVGTQLFMAPEVRYVEKGSVYDAFQADAYSLGVVLWSLITGQRPTLQTKYRRELTQHQQNIDPRVFSACRALLRVDPALRLSVENVLCSLREDHWYSDLIDVL